MVCSLPAYIHLRCHAKGIDGVPFSKSIYYIPRSSSTYKLTGGCVPYSLHSLFHNEDTLVNNIYNKFGPIRGTIFVFLILLLCFLCFPFRFYLLLNLQSISNLRAPRKYDKYGDKVGRTKVLGKLQLPNQEILVNLHLSQPPVLNDAALVATKFLFQHSKKLVYVPGIRWECVEDISQIPLAELPPPSTISPRCPFFLRGVMRIIGNKLDSLIFGKYGTRKLGADISNEFAKSYKSMRPSKIAKFNAPSDTHNYNFHKLFEVIERHAQFSTRERIQMLSLCTASFKIFYANTIATRDHLHTTFHRQNKPIAESYFKKIPEPSPLKFKLLHLYALAGHKMATTLALSLGASPNDTTSPLSLTPLHLAAGLGKTDIVALLLSFGAKIDMKDAFGCTALHWAVATQRVAYTKYNQLGTVALLLQWGAKVDAVDAKGNTPLCVLARSGCGNIHLVNLLASCGASLTHVNKKGRTALQKVLKRVAVPSEFFVRNGIEAKLFAAASIGDVEEVKRLGTLNPQLDQIQQTGLAPIHIATTGGHVETVEELVRMGAKLDNQTIEGNTALHLAVQNNSEQLVLELLRLGADRHKFNKQHKSPLEVAVEKEQKTLVELLADHTYNGVERQRVLVAVKSVEMLKSLEQLGISVRDNQHVMFSMAKTSPIDVVRECIQTIPELLDAVSDYKKTLLHTAVISGRVDVARVLISAGAQIDSKTNMKETPLYFAQSKEMATVLLERGASPNLKDYTGLSILAQAVQSRNTEVVETLLNYGAHVEPSLAFEYGWSTAEHSKVLSLLLSHGLDVRTEDKEGLTALHHAAKSYANDTVVTMLVDAGVDPNARDTFGNTALHYASASNYYVTCELVKLGADVNAKNKKGETPLDLVKYDPRIIEVLAQKGQLLFSERDADGRSPLEKAIRAKQHWKVRVLLSLGAMKVSEGEHYLKMAEEIGYVSTEREIHQWLKRPIISLPKTDSKFTKFKQTVSKYLPKFPTKNKITTTNIPKNNITQLKNKTSTKRKKRPKYDPYLKACI